MALLCPVSACAVTFAGQEMLGGCVSATTLTLKEQLAAFPVLSTAVQFTLVVPEGKAVPDAGLQSTRTPGQLSVAVGFVKFTTAVVWPFGKGTVMA